MFNKRMNWLISLTVGMSLTSWVNSLHAQGDGSDWSLPCAYRVAVSVDPNVSDLSHAPVGVEIDFRKLLRDSKTDERVDTATIRVVRRDPRHPDSASIVDPGMSEPLPHQLTGDFSNDDMGMVWWRMHNEDDRHFYIYFDTKGNHTKLDWQPQGLVGVGDALRYNDGQPGFTGSVGLHSTYWHLDWDGDGLRDMIGIGLRTYDHGSELEAELGNTVYFYKNIGTAQAPLFAPPCRVKASDGSYVRSPYMYQNIFPSDWDGDGDTDFFGFRGNTLDLYENTGERDNNGLHILHQPKEVMQMQVSDYRENDPNPLGKRYWALRGARHVDWDGDGDRDLIVTMRTVNEVGEEDSSRGIIPYGNGLEIFEVFINTAESPEDDPVFDKPFVLREERGLVISAFGPAPGGCEYVDWDGDGDRDFLFHDLTNRPLEGGRIMFCENIGTRDKPLLLMPVPLIKAADSPFVCDWNNDGRFDLIAGAEFFENINPRSGQASSVQSPEPLGTYYPKPRAFPKLVSRGLAQQVDPLVITYFTISVDWDGDGALDLVSGYQNGINYYRNKGTTLNPVFERPVAIHADGKPIDLPNWFDPQADEPAHWGPQGPGEPRHGWSIPAVADWDGDGDLDMFVTSQRWQVQYFENVGTRSEPRLARGREVHCGGDPHEFSWRSKVSIGDIDGDGVMELVVTSHQDNSFYAYEAVTAQDDDAFLELTRGVCLKLEDGQPVQGWYGGQNNNGDNHSQLVDWDGDGDLDLLNGSLWAVWYYENIGTATSPMFKAHGKFKANGKVIHTFNHAGSFNAADWNDDGRLDLLMGAECPSDQPLGSSLHLFDRSYIENNIPTASLDVLQVRKKH